VFELKLLAPMVIPPPPPIVLPPAALDDPSFRAFISPTFARLNVETGSEQQLSIQVRVHEGVTDIRATGAGASLLDARQHELRLALATEGLRLGDYDSDHRDRHDAELDPELPLRRARASTPSTIHSEGVLSVKA
jgi:hypothetical protein